MKKYTGIIAASVYGLFMRLLFDTPIAGSFPFSDIFSVAFVWVVPMVMGYIVVLLACYQKNRLSAANGVIAALASIAVFFGLCILLQIEDVIGLLIISVAFVGAAILGALVGKWLIAARKYNPMMLAPLLLPLLGGFTEARLPTPQQTYEVKTSLIIKADADKIWENVIRVPEIKPHEYAKGFYNLSGIPQPLYADLDGDTIGAIRTGHFGGGLIFKETVTEWDKPYKIAFSIAVMPSLGGQTIFDQHVLKSGRFKFLDAAYRLNVLSNGETEVVLSSSYWLKTNNNFYASKWGNSILNDFQARLLAVIKKRCEEMP